MKKFINLLMILATLSLAGSCHMSHSDAYLRQRVMLLYSDKGFCSGEQVRSRASGQDYILTAGHCAILAENGSIKVKTEDGKERPVLVIAEDPTSDMLLLQGIPNLRGLDVSDTDNYRFQHVHTWTHGLGMDTYHSEGDVIQPANSEIPLSVIDTPEAEAACSKMPKYKIMDMESIFGPMKVCALKFDSILTTAFVAPGSSGGPVFDESGELTGVVSYKSEEGFSGFVPAKSIKAFLDNF